MIMRQRKPITSQHPSPSAAPPASRPRSRAADAPILNSFFTLFFIILIPRFLAANRAPISDCDETFNFWEAVHHLLFRGGQQTWEQTPQFALRSWLYAAVHAVVFQIVGTAVPWMASPSSFWFLCRFILAGTSAAVEAFAAAVFLRECRKMKNMTCAYLAVAFLVTSPGLFNHQISLLPTTTAATMLLLCTSLTIFDAKYFSIVPLLSGCAILLGWPFACVAYAPILLTTLHSYSRIPDGLKRVMARAVFAACVIMAASITCDTVM
jgi:alpha-1,2-mannosyltransferase